MNQKLDAEIAAFKESIKNKPKRKVPFLLKLFIGVSAIVISTVIAMCSMVSNYTPSQQPQSLVKGQNTDADDTQQCDAKSEHINKVRTVKKDIDLLTGPRKSAKKVINKKATSAFSVNQYYRIGPPTKVLEFCRVDGWSYVESTEPAYATPYKGWVPTDVLLDLLVSRSGKRIYRQNEVGIDDDVRPSQKKYVINALNSFIQDECKDGLESYPIVWHKPGSPKNNPIYFVCCGSTSSARNIYFSKSGIENKYK